MMTPNEIDTLLLCSKNAVRMAGPTTSLALTSLLGKGLVVVIDESNETYITTDRGNAHISQLCSLALPVPAWGDADGKIIKPHNQGV